MRQELERLVQRNMTVNEYEKKFSSLTRYAPELIATEKLKCTQFRKGLRDSIRASVTPFQHIVYQDLVEAARVVEQDQLNTQARREAIASKRKGYISQQRGPSFKKSTSSSSSGSSGTNTSNKPQCQQCGRWHWGKCMGKNWIRCYTCGEIEHLSWNCPSGVAARSNLEAVGSGGSTTGGRGNTSALIPGRGRGIPTQSGGRDAQPRIFAITQQEASESPDVITGTLFLQEIPIIVLFDSGASHSFISEEVVQKLFLTTYPLENALPVLLPTGTQIEVNFFVNEEVEIMDRKFLSKLIIVPMFEFDVILGMDWLSTNQVIIDCLEKKVKVRTPGLENLIFYGKGRKIPVISTLKAQQYLKKGNEAYLAVTVDIKAVSPKLQDIPVVNEYSDVFPKDLSGLPPDREIEFTIDIIPGTEPISKVPYRMATTELHELKTQLQDLLDK
ncbi:hypothetical protein AXF42_Ash005245 [Apostasia shenzhenica]|uniref:CCHC-type domain-containing protein n=1 Tax=Apostasia shenzhenica TaxID=1088818 RepID=A0A2I0B6E0_9ASPA|nr:hypothetical protein AXF42_Ash005245 [Apostasia shenzhenica]